MLLCNARRLSEGFQGEEKERERANARGKEMRSTEVKRERERERLSLSSEADPARLAARVVQPRLRDLDPRHRRSFVPHAFLNNSRHAMFSSKWRSTRRRRRRRRGGRRPARSEVRTRRALERVERRTHQRGRRRPGAEPVIRERAARDRPGRRSSSPRHAPPAGVIVCDRVAGGVGRGRDEVGLRGPLEPDAPLRVVRQSPNLDVELRIGRQIDRFLAS